jgi:hypothetical protein
VSDERDRFVVFFRMESGFAGEIEGQANVDLFFKSETGGQGD